MTNTYDTAMLVGARPNFVKVAPLINYFEANGKKVLLIHTGQHWDKAMSENIFNDIGLREPDVNLNVQSNSMNSQLGNIIIDLDKTTKEYSFKSLFVFGDVTSTLAGAIVAKNNNIPSFHVEAGLRSKNLDMPEERNRVMVDSICDKLFTPSQDAVDNLLSENISKTKIVNVGNIMIDTLLANIEKISSSPKNLLHELNIQNKYFVVTIHRPNNLNDKNLPLIFNALKEYSNEYDIVIPAHPRLKNFLDSNYLEVNNIKVIDPLSYISFLQLVNSSELVITDSGGLQEETTFLNKKCLTIREETERPITVTKGTNKIIGVNKNINIEIKSALDTKLSKYEEIDFWDGETSKRIYENIYGE